VHPIHQPSDVRVDHRKALAVCERRHRASGVGAYAGQRQQCVQVSRDISVMLDRDGDRALV
jgi:hypothetical protein